MTIGYGDISPLTPIAKKAAVLIGLWGQFYLVIITALVVGKYLTSEQDD
jgi:voltage-gated potassium channel